MRSYIVIAVETDNVFDLDISVKLEGKEIEYSIFDSYEPTTCDECGNKIGVRANGTEISFDHDICCKQR